MAARNRSDGLIGRKQKGLRGSFIRNSEATLLQLECKLLGEEVARPLRCAAGRRKVVSECVIGEPIEARNLSSSYLVVAYNGKDVREESGMMRFDERIRCLKERKSRGKISIEIFVIVKLTNKRDKSRELTLYRL